MGAREQVLSHDEISALLATPNEPGDSFPGAAAGENRYDFSNPAAAIRGMLPLIEGLFDGFADLFRTHLLDALRLELDLDRGAVSTERPADFVARLSDPCSVSFLEISPFPGAALLTLDSALVFSLVDGFFGGRGKSGPSTGRNGFSDTERRMISRLRSAAFAAIGEAFESYGVTDCRLIREEINPQLVGAGHSPSPLVLAPMHLTLGEGGGTAQLALAYSMLEPLRLQAAAVLQRVGGSAAPDATTRWRATLGDADVDLRCELTRVDLTLGELMELQAGDVIPIEIPEQVRLDVGGVALFQGQFGVTKGRRAFQVGKLLNLGGSASDALRKPSGDDEA